MRILSLSLLLTIPLLGAETPGPTIERLDAGLDELIAPGTEVLDLGGSFRWSEGPVWYPSTGEVLFSDVPSNVIHAWHPEKGYREFMRPSGFSGAAGGKQSGSNGLALDKDGHLLLCEHGDRRVSRFVEGKGKTTVADRWEGKRFNSPNDLVVHSSGAIYFTDPIYGLAGGEKDPAREIDFCGVFRVAPEGKVELLARDLERPNGIGLSPDEKSLYVANSHRPRPVIMVYPLDEKGMAGEGKVFFDAGSLEGPGSQDGLKVDARGNVWATGPGGLLILNPQGKLLGRVLARRSVANVGFGGPGGKDVFLTATDRLLVFRRK